MSKQTEAIADAPNPASDNLSIEALIAQRTWQPTETEEPTEQADPETEAEEIEDTEPEETPEDNEIETEEEPEETDEETPEEESQTIDLLSLSPEEIQTLAKKARSRLLADVGKLRAENRVLQAELNKPSAAAKPLPEPIPDNPFGHLKTVDELTAKYKELEKVAEETDRILEDHEDYAAEDVITLGDKEFTKKEIRQANRNARNAMLKYLPAQAAQIQKIGQLQAMKAQYNAAIPVEIPELADENSQVAKQYQAILADPLVRKMRELVPDIDAQLDYILAHFTRSTNSLPSKPKTPAASVKIKAKVPASPIGAAGARSGAAPVRKAVEQARQRYEKTGSAADWQALRLAQMQNT